MSERHACRLVGLSRDSYRNAPVASAQTEALKTKIVEIAHARRRFGYRRVHDLLRMDFPGVNHKRVYRLYSNANRKRPATTILTARAGLVQRQPALSFQRCGSSSSTRLAG
jgi:hypothetical protein